MSLTGGKVHFFGFSHLVLLSFHHYRLEQHYFRREDQKIASRQCPIISWTMTFHFFNMLQVGAHGVDENTWSTE